MTVSTGAQVGSPHKTSLQEIFGALPGGIRLVTHVRTFSKCLLVWLLPSTILLGSKRWGIFAFFHLRSECSLRCLRGREVSVEKHCASRALALVPCFVVPFHGRGTQAASNALVRSDASKRAAAPAPAAFRHVALQYVRRVLLAPRRTANARGGGVLRRFLATGSWTSTSIH